MHLQSKLIRGLGTGKALKFLFMGILEKNRRKTRNVFRSAQFSRMSTVDLNANEPGGKPFDLFVAEGRFKHSPGTRAVRQCEEHKHRLGFPDRYFKRLTVIAEERNRTNGHGARLFRLDHRQSAAPGKGAEIHVTARSAEDQQRHPDE